jgi:hypothetical protein
LTEEDATITSEREDIPRLFAQTAAMNVKSLLNPAQTSRCIAMIVLQNVKVAGEILLKRAILINRKTEKREGMGEKVGQVFVGEKSRKIFT